MITDKLYRLKFYLLLVTCVFTLLSLTSFKRNFVSVVQTTAVQEDSVIYFNLTTCKYSKHEEHRYSALASRKIFIWAIHIDCKECIPGNSVLSFFGHDNLATGKAYELPKEISYKEFNQLNFLKLDSLISYLKAHENRKQAKLYMIETVGGKYYKYHVELSGGWNEE